jgi:hypothetical protein
MRIRGRVLEFLLVWVADVSLLTMAQDVGQAGALHV